MIKKGEVYERQMFTIKDARFKQEHFLDEVKVFYTDVINGLVKDEKEKLSAFKRGDVYLATKKIGKNNPKAEEIKKLNEARTIQRQIRLHSIIRSYRTGIVLWITLWYRGWSERKS